MCYLKLDKALMTNLQESMYRELLLTNSLGAYCSTTVVGCNIRKYHGLLVVPVPEIDEENHVLLSSLDETVVQHGAEFNLGLHKYQGDNYSPKGHKYIESFDWEYVPTLTYRIGGVKLRKEILLQRSEARLLVRYTLLEAHSPTMLRLRPFLAFRSVRQWTHRNYGIDGHVEDTESGVKAKLYPGYPDLHMQVSKDAEFHTGGTWYDGLDYPKERERGYESNEDLYVPGYFEMSIKKGETVIFAAGIDPADMADIESVYEEERLKIDKRNSFYHCLLAAARQFHFKKDGEKYIIAGHPWFKCRARDFFVSLPGFTTAIGENERFEAYMRTAEKALTRFMRKERIGVQMYEMEQPDTLLWAFWSLQRYARRASRKLCFEKYGALLTEMLAFIEQGTHSNLEVHSNGLLYSYGRDRAVTWMNATADGRPITPRSGYIVEFNALWYNAICFMAQLYEEQGGEEYEGEVKRLREFSEKVAQSFRDVFLNEYGYLLDYVDGNNMDWSVRPNMIFAVALDFSPLDTKQKKSVLDICTKELITPKGMRSLSPKSGGYNPIFAGPQVQRDYAYHQGTAWPWLTGFYIEAYLKVYKMSGVGYIERLMIAYEDELYSHCVGSLPELFDGNPPYHARGAISFAMNVSGILRAIRTLDKYNLDKD